MWRRNSAGAICEAASRPDVRFVRVKSKQAGCALAGHIAAVAHRSAHDGCESIREQLAEFGVVESKGIENVGAIVRMLDEIARSWITFQLLGRAAERNRKVS